jgi:hypothetical protein
MKEPNRKRIVMVIATRIALKLFFVAALLSASVVVYAARGYFLGYNSSGDTLWLWCDTSSGNYYSRCDTSSCPTGQSCPCEMCNTGPCQQSANAQCAQPPGEIALEEPPIN